MQLMKEVKTLQAEMAVLKRALRRIKSGRVSSGKADSEVFSLQQFSGWLSKNCDENPRMCKFSIQNPHQECTHARILVAIFGQPTRKPL